MGPRRYYVGSKRVPSVTTILGHRKQAEGLIAWAAAEATAGRNYRETRDAAAGKGTVVHRMIHRHALGLDPFETDAGDLIEDPDCLRAFGAFCDWFASSGATIVSAETALVSERYRYGGTLDAMLLFRLDGKLCTGDWKTSRKIYGDMVCQIAAYRNLWNENQPADEATGDGHILRFDKETGQHEHHVLTPQTLDLGFETFLKLLDVYHADRILDKAIGR